MAVLNRWHQSDASKPCGNSGRKGTPSTWDDCRKQGFWSLENGWGFHRQRWRKSILGHSRQRGWGMEVGKCRIYFEEQRVQLDLAGWCVRYVCWRSEYWAGAITKLYSIREVGFSNRKLVNNFWIGELQTWRYVLERLHGLQCSKRTQKKGG